MWAIFLVPFAYATFIHLYKYVKVLYWWCKIFCPFFVFSLIFSMSQCHHLIQILISFHLNFSLIFGCYNEKFWILLPFALSHQANWNWDIRTSSLEILSRIGYGRQKLSLRTEFWQFKYHFILAPPQVVLWEWMPQPCIKVEGGFQHPIRRRIFSIQLWHPGGQSQVSFISVSIVLSTVPRTR